MPLIEAARQLIADEKPESGYLFDVYSDQKMNEYLKKIADMAGINKKLRNHAGRHTFATLFLNKTNDLASLQKLLGHSRITETMKYAHVSTQKIEEEMNNFERLIKL